MKSIKENQTKYKPANFEEHDIRSFLQVTLDFCEYSDYLILEVYLLLELLQSLLKILVIKREGSQINVSL